MIQIKCMKKGGIYSLATFNLKVTTVCVALISTIIIILEMRKIKDFISMDVTKLPNSDAKSTFFQLLSLPLQSICRLATDQRILNNFSLLLQSSEENWWTLDGGRARSASAGHLQIAPTT